MKRKVQMSGSGNLEELAASPLDGLTEREHEVLELVAAGLSNKEIGKQLYLREKTIKYHMTNILQKLQVRNRVEAAMLAARNEGRSSRG